jgi:hypothetical protein
MDLLKIDPDDIEIFEYHLEEEPKPRVDAKCVDLQRSQQDSREYVDAEVDTID